MFDDATLPELPARRILLGVSGSIAAYSVPQSILWLRHVLGVEVRAILTRQATTMVAPRAVAVASGHPVALDSDGLPNDPAVPHIELTRWADVMLVLPASANTIGKAANGIADDVLTTCIIAAACPVVFVPSMNEIMWRKPAVQRNVATLQADGHGIIFPVEGIALADGKPTVGAMPDIDDIVARLAEFLQQSAAGQQPAAETPANGISFPDLDSILVEARA
jgi:phosphopantothenoylcysteine synthetase/decarboxylase